MLLSITLWFLSLANVEAIPQSYTRGNSPLEIQLLDNGTNAKWGLQSRTADHATVAMNSRKDILVSYHTDRNELDSSLLPKQVEAVLFEFDGVDTWDYVDTFLLGSADFYDPLDLIPPGVPQYTKCERPDVIAVNEQFFVVWTRISQYSQTPNEPAVLECAWIDPYDSSGPQVYDYYGPSDTGSGRGYELNNNYNVLACAGVPDAVLLNDGAGADLPKVAVVYPAMFSISGSTRSFDLLISTSSLDITNTAAPISDVGPDDLLNAHVAFNGDDSNAAGLILPDLARGIDENQFILAYEEQFTVTGPPSRDYGLIRMCRVELSAGGTWSAPQSHTFGSSQSTLARRRPNLSSYITQTSASNIVTIAFNTHPAGDRDADADVVFSEWTLDANDGIFGVPWPAGVGQPPHTWPNDTGTPPILYDFRPIPLSGHDANFRRCFAESFPAGTNPPTCDLVEYEITSNPPALQALTNKTLARTAVAYFYDPTFTVPDFVALTWEQEVDNGAKWRIRLLVR